MSDKPDTIVITAPAGTKARWVHAAQARGMKLSDYVRQSVEPPPPERVVEPCMRCGSHTIRPDTPGQWLCAVCGLVA